MPRRFIIEWTALLVFGLLVIILAYYSQMYLIMTFSILVYLYSLRLMIRDIKRFRKEE